MTSAWQAHGGDRESIKLWAPDSSLRGTRGIKVAVAERFSSPMAALPWLPELPTGVAGPPFGEAPGSAFGRATRQTPQSSSTPTGISANRIGLHTHSSRDRALQPPMPATPRGYQPAASVN